MVIEFKLVPAGILLLWLPTKISTEVQELTLESQPTGVALADALHHKRFTIAKIREFCLVTGFIAHRQPQNESGVS